MSGHLNPIEHDLLMKRAVQHAQKIYMNCSMALSYTGHKKKNLALGQILTIMFGSTVCPTHSTVLLLCICKIFHVVMLAFIRVSYACKCAIPARNINSKN